MDNAIQLFAALAGSFGFAALFNLHGKKLAFAALGGLLSWSVYLLLEHWNVDAYACAFAASVALTLYAELMARCHKSPVTVFLVTAAIPLIPGARRMQMCSQDRAEEFFIIFTSDGVV